MSSSTFSKSPCPFFSAAQEKKELKTSTGGRGGGGGDSLDIDVRI